MTAADDLVSRFGSAKHPDRPPAHVPPPGCDRATVDALGQLSAALEVAEEARGLLYAFHRRCGESDIALQGAVDALREAGHGELADQIGTVMVGRDTIAGMWTFQMVESYDRDYWSVYRAVEAHAREQLAGGTPHLFEARMKHDEQKQDGPAH